MSAWGRPGMDDNQVSQYCKRIGTSDRILEQALRKQADMELLREICAAQVYSVPFENLNMMYEPAKHESGGKTPCDLKSLFEKIVVKGRGGYCFEVNEILAQALTGMGFKLHTAAGRVVLTEGHRSFPDEIFMTTIEHELVIVHLEGQDWVCDAGQGSATPLEPVLLTSDLLDRSQTQGKGGLHRVRRGLLASAADPASTPHRQPEREGWYMQKYSEKRQKWHDVYFFTEQEWRTQDYAPANLFCSYNHSLFNHHLVVALHTRQGRKTISDSKLRIYTGNEMSEQTLNGQGALTSALQEHFLLAF